MPEGGAQPRDGGTGGSWRAAAVLVQLLTPLRIIDVGLASRNVPGVPRIDAQHLEPAVFENLVDRNSVDPRRLHGDGANPNELEPICPRVQVRGETLKCADRLGIAIGGDRDDVERCSHVQARGILIENAQPASTSPRSSCVVHLALLSWVSPGGGVGGNVLTFLNGIARRASPITRPLPPPDHV